MLEQVASGLRVHRQRPLRPFDPATTRDPAAAPGHRAGQVAAQGGRPREPERDLHTTKRRAAWSQTAGGEGTKTPPPRFANQAQAAGVKNNVIKDRTTTGTGTFKLAFSIDFLGHRAYLNQVQQGSLRTPVQRDDNGRRSRAPGPTSGRSYNLALASTRRGQSVQRSSTRLPQNRVQHRRVHSSFRWPHRAFIDQGQGLKPSKGTSTWSFGHGFPHDLVSASGRTGQGRHEQVQTSGCGGSSPAAACWGSSSSSWSRSWCSCDPGIALVDRPRYTRPGGHPASLAASAPPAATRPAGDRAVLEVGDRPACTAPGEDRWPPGAGVGEQSAFPQAGELRRVVAIAACCRYQVSIRVRRVGRR